MSYDSRIILIAIGLAILHVALMEWVDTYRNAIRRKLRTIHRRIQLTEYDNGTN